MRKAAKPRILTLKWLTAVIAVCLCMLMVPMTASANQSVTSVVEQAIKLAAGFENIAVPDTQADRNVIEDDEVPQVDPTMHPSADSVDASTFDELKQLVEDANGPSEIVISQSMVATQAIYVSRSVRIFDNGDIAISRDSQTHSIFVVEANGDLTLVGITLTASESSKSTASSNDVSPVETWGSLSLINSKIIGFVSVNGGGLRVLDGTTIISNSAISNNAARAGNSQMGIPCGGGIDIEGGSVLVENNSKIDNNVAHSSYYASRDKMIGGVGGGIYVEESGALSIIDSSVSGNEAGVFTANSLDSTKNGAGGGIFLSRGTSFVMDGSSVIASNSAYAWANNDFSGGGGICIYNGNSSININHGVIENNFSRCPGGGIYLHTGEISMQSVAVVGNSVTNPQNGATGGGLWFCEEARGGGRLYATNGALITDNAAHSYEVTTSGTRYGGTDFVSIEPWYIPKDLKLPTRLPDGRALSWGNDGSTSSVRDLRPELLALTGLNPVQEFIDAYQADATLKMRSSVEDGYDLSDYSVIVRGNSSGEGGGIACNGNLIIGEDKDISLTIKKEWKDSKGELLAENAIPNVAVTVNVYNGTKIIDTVTLSRDNDWSETLTDLPLDGSYWIQEAAGSVDSNEFEVSYSYVENSMKTTTIGAALMPSIAKSEFTATVTNTAKPKETDLTIIKTWMQMNHDGSVAPAEAVDVDSIIVNIRDLNDAAFSRTVGLTKENGWNVTVEGLPLTGKYVVEETNATGYDVTYQYDKDLDAEFIETPLAEGDYNVTITNVLPPEDALVTVKKSWFDFDGTELAATDIAVDEVTAVVYVDGVALEDEITLNADNGWTTTVNVPLGSTVTIDEADVVGYEVSYEYGDDNVEGLVLNPTDYTGSATIVNTKIKDPEFGRLTIAKTLAGNFPAIDGGNIGNVTAVFRIVGVAEDEDGNEVTVYDQYAGLNFAIDGSRTQEIVLDNLPLGTYTVEEIQYDGAGYVPADPNMVTQTVVLGTKAGPNNEDQLDVTVEFTNNTNGDRPSSGIVNRYEFTPGEEGTNPLLAVVRYINGVLAQND